MADRTILVLIPSLLTLHLEVNGLVWKLPLNMSWLCALRATLLAHVGDSCWLTPGSHLSLLGLLGCWACGLLLGPLLVDGRTCVLGTCLCV